MKHIKLLKTACFFLLILLITGSMLQTEKVLAADVCGEGLGIPPFLSSGADPNLLLVLDNSGSMLDTAYRDDDRACTDNTFAPATTYAGIFEPTKWYYWANKPATTSFYFAPVEYTEDTSGNKTFTPDITLEVITDDIEYRQADVVVRIGEKTDEYNEIYEVVTAFAASGNLLNWASASKFDIQKEILTGGKYDVVDDVLISEGRGCSSRPYIKEVPVSFSIPADSPDGTTDRVITFSVRGFEELAYSTPDNLTRIAILGVTKGGFTDPTNNPNYQRCLDALEEWNKEDTNQGQFKGAASDCLDYGAQKNGFEDNSNSAWNGSVHECWFAKKEEWTYEQYMTAPQVSVVATENACESIYTGGFEPTTISVRGSGYVCSGDISGYNPPPGPGDGNYNPDTSTPDVYGYVGRCWVSGTPPGDCVQATCDSGTYPSADPSKKGESVCLNELEYTCSGYWWSDDACHSRKNGGGNIIPLAQVPADPTCDPTATGGTDGHWVGDKNSDERETCFKNALWDFCNGLTIPEEIDPSDPLGPGEDTGDTWGLIGSLIDASVQNYFDNEGPIIEMQVRVAQPQDESPEGIIHEVAGDIRIGVMAFNDNGALTECEIEDTLDDKTIVKYCPEHADGTQNNYDGAQVIVPIKNTDATHLAYLTEQINAVPAISWTPLAEAFYNALGYYGQDTSRRLDVDDFKIPAEDLAYEDPVQYWCQDNNILIITEGQSTTDIRDEVLTMMTNMSVEDSTNPLANEGECLDSATERNLYGSTYFDDLTYFGQNAPVQELFKTPGATPGQIETDDGVLHDKQNITTYMVVAGNLQPDGSGNECNAATLMSNAAENGGTDMLTGEDPAQLESNLRDALNSILYRASAGSASSVISSSRSGDGGVYQAVFWPKIARDMEWCTNDSTPLCTDQDPQTWVGDVHAFFIDENGLLWDDYSSKLTDGKVGTLWSEDANGNGILDPGEDWYPMVGDTPTVNNVLDGDRRIVTFYNTATKSTQICFNHSVIETGVCAASDYLDDPEESEPVDLREFNYYLWSAKDQLSDIMTDDISINRNLIGDTWDFSENRRYIFTWNDLDNDGIVDSDFNKDGSIDDDGDGIADREEILQFVPDMNEPALDTTPANSSEPRTDFISDFNVDNDPVKLSEFIRWVRGEEILEEDSAGIFTPYLAGVDLNNNGIQDIKYRCRKRGDCSPDNPITDRLGDIIHSTPTVVSRPAERYHFPYKDSGYFEFYKKHVARRNVIYFGANDGMLHAVNGGFTQAGLNKFATCSSEQQATDPSCSGSYPKLGDELWAYIPYNLQPHLSCLLDKSYDHKYFVDAAPRIFDVRIFPPDSDVHIEGWGTILVGYMRFGGAPIDADIPAVDNRKFISSYFILDITDPERPPTLIAEMTMTNDGMYANLGYTTPMPTVVPMRNDLGNSEWFLVLGNGPTTIKGENNQPGKVAVLSLNALTGYTLDSLGNYETSDRKAFRIPNIEFNSSSTDADFGILTIPPDSSGGLESFVGDMVTVDFDLDVQSIPGIGIPYKADVVYFGTVDGSGFDPSGTYWDGDGRLFRLVSQKIDMNGDQEFLYPKDWELRKLLDAQAPITAAPNIAFDGDNFWTYFGTGRFFAPEDKTDDSQQYFFGVKEPRTNCDFTWAEINWVAPDPGNTAGSQGLMRTDQIRVIESSPGLWSSNDDYVYCENDDGSACSLTPPLSTPISLTDSDGNVSLKEYYKFSALVNYIKGERCGTTDDTAVGIDGWYRQLNDPRERSLGMPTLLGGLTTFTTYQPFADICLAEGVSNLYGVYYLTGTAWYENVFGTYSNSEGISVVKDRLSLGKGLATTPSLQVGSGEHDAKAFIQTSTGEIVEVEQDNLPIQEFKSGRTSWRTE